MGLKVTAREAALLSNRAERTIRRWVATGRLTAEPSGLREPGPGVGPNRWLIDVDQLAQVPGIRLDTARLAQLQAQAALAGAGENVLAQLTALRRDVEALQRQVAQLSQTVDTLQRSVDKKGRTRR